MKKAEPLMKFDPMDGSEKPYPSEAEQYREWHGDGAWLFNPYTGQRRDAYAVGSDRFGYLIRAPGEVLRADKISWALGQWSGLAS